MMPVEWPIAGFQAASSSSRAHLPRARLDSVRADFFLDDALRLTEQERALMSGMLSNLLDQLIDEIGAALPAGLAAPLEGVRSGLIARLWSSGTLDRAGLVDVLLQRSDEQRLANGTTDAALATLVGDDDPSVAEAAMALTVARGRRRDRFGRLGIEFDDLSRDDAAALAWLVAAAVRKAVDRHADGLESVFAASAEALIARHAPDRRLDDVLMTLAETLYAAGKASDANIVGWAEQGDIALMSALLGVRAGLDRGTAWRMTVEQGAHCVMLLARVAGLERGAAAKILVAVGPWLGIQDPAAAIADYDRIDAVEARRSGEWLTLPRPFRDALEAME